MFLSFDAITWQLKDGHSHHEGLDRKLDKTHQDAQLSSDECRSCINGIVSNDDNSSIHCLLKYLKVLNEK